MKKATNQKQTEITRMATRQIGFSSTTTVTLEPQSSSSSSSQPSQNVVLRLHVPRKKVTWKEGTVDNEFLNRKSSKKCCIFHKQKPFDEDDSDEEDDSDRNRDRDDSGGGGRKRGDLDGVGSSGCCHRGGSSIDI